MNTRSWVLGVLMGSATYFTSATVAYVIADQPFADTAAYLALSGVIILVSEKVGE